MRNLNNVNRNARGKSSEVVQQVMNRTNSKTSYRSPKCVVKVINSGTLENSNPVPIPRMMTIREVAATGILPEAALRRMVKDKTIPAIHSGKTAYINYDALCYQLSHLGCA